MCRSRGEGGRRCGCDSSAARQSRRVAQRVRSSAIVEDMTPAPSSEETISLTETVPPSIESIKEQAKHVSRLVGHLVEGKALPDDVEREVTLLGESISQRADADAYVPNIDEETQSLLDFTKEKSKESDEFVKKIIVVVNKQKALNKLLRAKSISQESYNKQWDALVKERQEAEEARQAIKQEILKKAEKVTEHKKNLANSYRSILSQIRDMGGELNGISPKSHKPSIKILQEAMENFPADWIDDSNASNDIPLRVKKTVARAHYNHRVVQEDKKEFSSADFVHTPSNWQPPADNPFFAGWVKLSDVETEDTNSRFYITRIQRSVYRTGDSRVTWVAPKYQAVLAVNDTPPKGRGWEKFEMPGSYFDGRVGKFVGEPKTIWRREKKIRQRVSLSAESELTISEDESNQEITRPGYSTASHEFSHRIEAVRPHIKSLEQSFLKRRTTLPNGEREKRQVYTIKGRQVEWVRPDGFAHRYMGKEYNDGSTEILSTGTEALFSGSFGGLKGLDGYKEDKDMRNFILGTLASA